MSARAWRSGDVARHRRAGPRRRRSAERQRLPRRADRPAAAPRSRARRRRTAPARPSRPSARTPMPPPARWSRRPVGRHDDADVSAHRPSPPAPPRAAGWMMTPTPLASGMISVLRTSTTTLATRASASARSATSSARVSTRLTCRVGLRPLLQLVDDVGIGDVVGQIVRARGAQRLGTNMWTVIDTCCRACFSCSCTPMKSVEPQIVDDDAALPGVGGHDRHRPIALIPSAGPRTGT